MQILNHQPIIKTYGNGMQITFPNKYTVIIKSGPGAACTQTKTASDPTEMLMASRFGGNYGPDVEVEIYDVKNGNITGKFTASGNGVLDFVTPLELVNLLYIVSRLK